MISDSSRARPISLSLRFTWASAARLALLSVLLGVVILVSVRDPFAGSYSVMVAMWTLAAAFTLSGVYAWFLRAGRHLRLLVNVQVVLDQVIWTVVVYLSGGASSGATSFYGVSCFFGALLGGYRGALLAAVAAAACYGGLVGLLATGWLPIPPDQPASAYSLSSRDIAYSAVANLLMLTAVVLLAGTLTERLRATGGQLIRAEERADQAEREALLGRLAAGLAHEIRNPLGAISGSVRLLRSTPTLLDDDRQLCDIIEREAERLNDLVTDMLDLSKPRQPELGLVDVASVAREVVELARHSGRGGTDVAVRYEGEGSLSVVADEAMLRQMIWNLVRNAVQASNPGDAVVVSVELDGDQVVVSVADNGAGLLEDAKARIFDPFFTTRSKGTGVGLAVVKRIVNQHDFRIELTDTPGGGATFRVWMGPRDQKPPDPSGKPERWTLSPKGRA